MEPFGLLNLLKSLLPTADTPPQTTADNKGNGVDNSAMATDTSEREKQDDMGANPPTPNAFLDFVQRHDERKRQMKKP